MFFYKGKKYILGDLAKEYNISRKTLGRRIQNKWDIETALKTPPKPRKRKIVCVEKQLVYESATEAAFIYKIPASNIARAIKRNIKAAGFHWSYY